MNENNIPTRTGAFRTLQIGDTVQIAGDERRVIEVAGGMVTLEGGAVLDVVTLEAIFAANPRAPAASVVEYRPWLTESYVRMRPRFLASAKIDPATALFNPTLGAVVFFNESGGACRRQDGAPATPGWVQEVADAAATRTDWGLAIAKFDASSGGYVIKCVNPPDTTIDLAGGATPSLGAFRGAGAAPIAPKDVVGARRVLGLEDEVGVPILEVYRVGTSATVIDAENEEEEIARVEDAVCFAARIGETYVPIVIGPADSPAGENAAVASIIGLWRSFGGRVADWWSARLRQDTIVHASGEIVSYDSPRDAAAAYAELTEAR